MTADIPMSHKGHAWCSVAVVDFNPYIVDQSPLALIIRGESRVKGPQILCHICCLILLLCEARFLRVDLKQNVLKGAWLECGIGLC